MKDIQDNHDGYHTFKELYECRHALFCVVANQNRHMFFKSEKDNHYDGWFLVYGNVLYSKSGDGIGLECKQVSFHMPNSWYDRFCLDIKNNDGYDGHTTEDVIKRLIEFSKFLAE